MTITNFDFRNLQDGGNLQDEDLLIIQRPQTGENTAGANSKRIYGDKVMRVERDAYNNVVTVEDGYWEDLGFPSQGINPAGSAAPPAVDDTTFPGTLLFSNSTDNMIGGVHLRLAQARRDARPHRRSARQGPDPARGGDLERADLDLVFDALDTQRARPLRQAGPLRLLGAADGLFRRRSLSDSAIPRAAGILERTAILQSLRPDRDERLHLVRGARRRGDRADGDVSDRQDLPAQRGHGRRRAGTACQHRRARRASGSPARTSCSGTGIYPAERARLSRRRGRAQVVPDRRYRHGGACARLSLREPAGSDGEAARPHGPGREAAHDWIKTIPGKGWCTYFRLYGPTQPYFDRTWVLPDVEVVK